MDDLDLIRDLGRDLEHEPPASLARQRNRLLDAAKRRRRGPGRWTLLGIVAAVTAAAILVPAVVFRARDAKPVALNSIAPGQAFNVLLLGMDGRQAAHQRSDTMMLVHVPADRKRVRAVSVPRDLLVRIPECRSAGGAVFRAHRGLINSAFTAGGTDCAARTLESVANVRIDRTVLVDFTGFAEIVDALGGVEMTVPAPISDAKAGLRLPAGKNRLDGRKALAYVRVRHGIADGSDLARIERQHRFLEALVREVRERATGNPVRLARFLTAAAGAVEAAPGLKPGELRLLAESFLKGGSITFDTVPVRPARQDPSRVEWDRAGADRMLAPFRTS
ncbi:transcriptional attenuator, LytR family [Actinomadura meyerae]|uniref:Transcriptional attenuator, LytR family n=1 Tax=Actinomadura meyerae TaxID=240840 RepID=A0A239P577_9ACTN|nr:LCP family protein [Actinomadura meyerae]SNT62271.1 transcriptional attenuator, LytR family [Actinomadura meyerae]